MGMGTVRYSFDEYRQVGGIWFPVRLTQELKAAGQSTSFEIVQQVRVNEGVGAEDFKER